MKANLVDSLRVKPPADPEEGILIMITERVFSIRVADIFSARTNIHKTKGLFKFFERILFGFLLKLCNKRDPDGWINFLDVECGIPQFGQCFGSIHFRKEYPQKIVDCPPDFSWIIVFEKGGRIHRFEVLGGNLRDYIHPDYWPLYLWRENGFVVGERFWFQSFERGSSVGSGSNSEVLKIILFVPNDHEEVGQAKKSDTSVVSPSVTLPVDPGEYIDKRFQ